MVASPFTPVPGTRLLARDAGARAALARELIAWSRKHKLSSLHLLFTTDEDAAACEAAGMMLRHNVQFHWTHAGWKDFDAFLASLSHDKRKKIRQERRKVADTGVTFRSARGTGISRADWDFFYRCYEQTYLEHGNSPYLTRNFFERMARTMADTAMECAPVCPESHITQSICSNPTRATHGSIAGSRSGKLLDPSKPSASTSRFWWMPSCEWWPGTVACSRLASLGYPMSRRSASST